MRSPLLPDGIQLGTSLVIFALAAFLVAAHTLLAERAARESALGPRARRLAPWTVGGFLAVWLAAALAVGDAVNLPGFARTRLLMLAVGFGPVLLAWALLGTSATLKALNDATPPDGLIRLQAYRMAGLMFLFPFLYFRVVPAGFAIPAAVGDFLTGLAAPWVASAVAARRPGAIGWATAWNLFGILDLLVAPVAAVLSRAQVLQLYPLVLVPLFVGPPLGILTHLYSLRNLGQLARREAAAGQLERAVEPA